MALSTDVKWITNTMRAAPVVNGNTPGCLIAVLDALLVTGWGATTALSVSVADGIATATVNAGNSFTEHAVVRIEGATPAALNGDARVLTANNAQITFATTAPDGVATGTITLKFAPAGWEKVFVGTNKAVYRSTDVAGERLYLRVDDGNNLFARVRGFEAMSDVDTGTGPFPLDTMISGGGYWHKSGVSSATAVPYLIVADTRLMLQAMLFGVPQGATRFAAKVQGFGDIIAANPGGDAWATVLSAANVDRDTYLQYGGLSGAAADSSSSGMSCFARGWQGLGGAVYARPFPEAGRDDQLSGNSNTFGAAPSVVDGRIRFARMLLRDQVGVVFRGAVPGVYYIPQSGVASIFGVPLALVDGANGRRLAVVHVGSSPDSVVGAALIDVTGPWR